MVMKLSEKLSKGIKFKVGIILGGYSSEKEISLESGRHIYNSLNTDKYDLVPIFYSDNLDFWLINEALLWLNTTEDIKSELKIQKAINIKYQDIPKYIDFAFLGLHGKMAEDGSLQSLLELINIPYNGPGVLGSALGMDKYYQRKLLKAYGFKTPLYEIVDKISWVKDKNICIENIKKTLSYPFVSKPSREGCSTGVKLNHNDNDLIINLEEAFIWDNICICEEFINDMEITCTVLGNDKPIALTPTETPRKGEILSVTEKFLPGDASMITPPTNWDDNLIAKAKEFFVKVYKALNLSVYSRIDAFYKNGEFIVLEPNTLPGVTPSTMVFHQAAEAGMSSSNFFDEIIKYSIQAYEKKKGPR